MHPQCATKLLKDCVCAAPAYLAQACHPSITKEHLLHFDDCVWELWLKILGGVGGESPGCCSQSLDRSRMKAFLPSRHNGVGLRSWERTADFAWFASVASCIALEDDDFNFARKFLGSQSESAYTITLDALGGPSYLDRAPFEIIPIGEPEVLSDSTFYVDLFKEIPKLRLQKEMLNLANVVAHEKFVNYVAHSDTSEKIVLESVKRPNVSLLNQTVHCQPHASTSSCNQARVHIHGSSVRLFAATYKWFWTCDYLQMWMRNTTLHESEMSSDH